MKLATRAVHAGQSPDPTTGATVPPIYQTATYTQAAPGDHKGYEYSRTANPTRAGLEECLAALEGGVAACAFASGLAATDSVFASLLRPGQSIVAYSDLYGGTYRLLEQVYRPWGLQTRYTDSSDPSVFADLVDDSTGMVWVETPTNPLLRILDLAEISRAVRIKRPEGLAFVVDNTFATPALQLPLSLGADLVVHSMTKYLAGHSDLVGGAVVAAREEVIQPVRFHQNAAGAILGPFDSFLAQRGIKTLPLRMARHCENAARIAAWMRTRKEFASVIYPGLEDHPGHAVAKKQMSGYGGMVSAILPGGGEAARAFLGATRLFACAESLGGVESLINHPAVMTHASIPAEVRRRIGVVDGLIRLSVGIEDGDDLLEDLSHALASVR